MPRAVCTSSASVMSCVNGMQNSGKSRLFTRPNRGGKIRGCRGLVTVGMWARRVQQAEIRPGTPIPGSRPNRETGDFPIPIPGRIGDREIPEKPGKSFPKILIYRPGNPRPAESGPRFPFPAESGNGDSLFPPGGRVAELPTDLSPFSNGRTDLCGNSTGIYIY
jgi:hypothetical protein